MIDGCENLLQEKIDDYTRKYITYLISMNGPGNRELFISDQQELGNLPETVDRTLSNKDLVLLALTGCANHTIGRGRTISICAVDEIKRTRGDSKTPVSDYN